MPKRKGASLAKKAKYLRYKTEDRRNKHKANKLTKRIRNYKTQPPLLLNGIKKTNKNLAIAIERKLKG